MSPRVPLASIAAALAGAAAAAVLAACGSSGSQAVNGSTGPGTPNPQAVAISRCMRAHGVPNFPDPTSGPGGVGLSVAEAPGGATVTVAGIPFSGPAFQKAVTTCKFGPQGPPPKLSEQHEQQLLKFAQCMRAHGVPNFADPKFVGPVIKQQSDVNRNAPAMRRAAMSCNK